MVLNKSQNAQSVIAEIRLEIEENRKRYPVIRDAGVEALQRLLPIAHGDSGQCGIVANFLLNLYNSRFKFDLTDFRRLDLPIFNDCMEVLKMDFRPEKEVHRYFENGSQIWQKLARDWKYIE
jgi:hypothetical protein